MDIGNLNGIQNFLPLQKKQNNQVTKPELKNNEVEEQKTPQKQMVNAQMFLATIPNCSFKGSVKNDEMSDEEFEQKKQEIEIKIKTLPVNVQKEVKNWEFNKDNIELVNKILSDEKFFGNEKVIEYAQDLIRYVNSEKQVKLANKILDEFSDKEQVLFEASCCFILNAWSEEELEFINKILSKENITHVENQKSIVHEHPELYINGEMSDNESENAVDNFFEQNILGLMISNIIFDDKTVNTLLRTRFDDAEEYLNTISKFNLDNIELLSKLSNSKNIDGSELTPKQKIGFIDLIDAYKNCNVDLTEIQKQADNGIVDIEQLNKKLFSGILKNCSLSDEEISKIPDDKLTSWDMKYMHLLAKENDAAFGDLLRATNLYNFDDYIHDTSNVYGQTNAKTKEMFDENNMDYDKWLKPSVDNNVQFVAKDSNAQRLNQISSQIKEDMETLMQTPAKGFIKKQFPNYVKDGKFVIPPEIENSKVQLQEFTQNILKQLDPVFTRTKNNPKNPETAQKVLTIQDHLTQRVKDIENTGEIKSTKTLDLTIKMWDRNPSKDLFQGNYSTCCIGMGNVNSSAMPHYLMDSAYNMIELTDNKTGETVGNALCYFVKDEEGKTVFIVDNIEINNSVRPSDEVGKDLRDAITEYASNVAKEVTGNDDTPIYMSASYNDVPIDDLETSTQKVNFIGDIDSDEIYMDLYWGWTQKDNKTQKIPTQNLNLLKLK